MHVILSSKFKIKLPRNWNRWQQPCKSKLFRFKVEIVKNIPDDQGQNLAALLLNKPVLLWQQPAADPWNQKKIINYNVEWVLDINHKRFTSKRKRSGLQMRRWNTIFNTENDKCPLNLQANHAINYHVKKPEVININPSVNSLTL